MQRANSQLWTRIKTSSKAYLLWASLCAAPLLPLPSTSTTVRILNQLPTPNPGPETSMMLRTWRIFHFGGWWFSERAVSFCTCAEVWTATERSCWSWSGGQRAGDEVKSARWLWFPTRVSAMRTCLRVLGFQSLDSGCTCLSQGAAQTSSCPQPDTPNPPRFTFNTYWGLLQWMARHCA